MLKSLFISNLAGLGEFLSQKINLSLPNIKNYFMVRLSLILNGILIIAVGILFYLHFSSPRGYNDSYEGKSGKVKGIPDSSGFVYVNTDSLLHRYKFYNVLEMKVKKRQENIENELSTKVSAFEKEAAEFQNKVRNNGFLSQESAAMQEQELTKKQQGLFQLREDLTKQLMEESQATEKQLLDTVITFLKNYNRGRKYRYILNSSSFLYGPVNNDITETIANLLNERYDALNK